MMEITRKKINEREEYKQKKATKRIRFSTDIVKGNLYLLLRLSPIFLPFLTLSSSSIPIYIHIWRQFFCFVLFYISSYFLLTLSSIPPIHLVSSSSLFSFSYPLHPHIPPSTTFCYLYPYFPPLSLFSSPSFIFSPLFIFFSPSSIFFPLFPLFFLSFLYLSSPSPIFLYLLIFLSFLYFPLLSQFSSPSFSSPAVTLGRFDFFFRGSSGQFIIFYGEL